MTAEQRLDDLTDELVEAFQAISERLSDNDQKRAVLERNASIAAERFQRLVLRDELLVAVVHAPELGITYTAHRGGGAEKNGAPIRVSDTVDVRNALVATGLSYHRNESGFEDNTRRIAAIVPECRDLRRLGSAQLDLCLTACGTYDAYWEMYLSTRRTSPRR